MSDRAINQLLAGYAEGDAISQEARALRSILRRNGYRSDIFAPAESIAEGVEDDCFQLEDYRASGSDLLFYHYSIASEATLLFLNADAHRIVRYHNITPPEFFDGFDDNLAAQLRRARQELEQVVSAAATIWADSRFNASEIQPEPACPVEVVPLVCARPGESAAPDEAVGRRFDDSLKNILFVGRIVPNKCVEDLINMFAWIYRKFDAATRLIIVGSERSCPNYYAMLRMYADRLQLPNVCFAGFVNESELSAFYRAADVFVSSSLHEGFCLPLLEAMANNTPVLARNQGGMPEAVGNAGVLYEDASPRELAVLVNRLLNDRVLREEVLDTQSKRIAEHFGQIGEERIISLLENV